MPDCYIFEQDSYVKDDGIRLGGDQFDADQNLTIVDNSALMIGDIGSNILTKMVEKYQ